MCLNWLTLFDAFQPRNECKWVTEIVTTSFNLRTEGKQSLGLEERETCKNDQTYHIVLHERFQSSRPYSLSLLTSAYSEPVGNIQSVTSASENLFRQAVISCTSHKSMQFKEIPKASKSFDCVVMPCNALMGVFKI